VFFSVSGDLFWETLTPGSAKTEAPDYSPVGSKGGRTSAGWTLGDDHRAPNAVAVAVAVEVAAGVPKAGVVDEALLVHANNMEGLTLEVDTLFERRLPAPSGNNWLGDGRAGVDAVVGLGVNG
jgi:hypothetical protein